MNRFMKFVVACVSLVDRLQNWSVRLGYSSEEIQDACWLLKCGKHGKVTRPDEHGNYSYCPATDRQGPGTRTKFDIQDFVRAFGTPVESEEGTHYRLTPADLERLDPVRHCFGMPTRPNQLIVNVRRPEDAIPALIKLVQGLSPDQLEHLGWNWGRDEDGEDVSKGCPQVPDPVSYRLVEVPSQARTFEESDEERSDRFAYLAVLRTAGPLPDMTLFHDRGELQWGDLGKVPEGTRIFDKTQGEWIPVEEFLELYVDLAAERQRVESEALAAEEADALAEAVENSRITQPAVEGS